MLTAHHEKPPVPSHSQPARSSCVINSLDPRGWRRAGRVGHGGETLFCVSALFFGRLRNGGYRGGSGGRRGKGKVPIGAV